MRRGKAKGSESTAVATLRANFAPAIDKSRSKFNPSSTKAPTCISLAMPGSLADYLAKNYLNADPATERPKKKRKKTKAVDTASSGLIITDDDPSDILPKTQQDDEDSPFLDTSYKSAEFRRTKKSGWKILGGDNSDQAAADAIIASAAAERDAARAEDAEDPTVEETEDGLRMESGALAGLQTAEQTTAMVKAQERRKKAEEAQWRDPSAVAAQTQETIYRDASGRIINVAMKRAEAPLMGDVQRQKREMRKQELQEAKAMPLARGIEDETLNDELRARDRWNDPAAGFLTEKSKPGASVTGKPLYKGAFQPNRYGIRPGHRWDGVDRGNGFEKDWFAARNKKGRMEALDYQWQMDE
ncbi:Bud13 [Penicillium maclennaniae]|uniref:Bud13 n=1 Tax=Penicillium maclennaniae TaxID=1343394 RepID=UPI00253FA6C2|nr:Bud13 [Penicillium maclennaniae]KAJ5667764.1 Bud13 [Penicillium maclennaniae]